ncbi:MAG: tetratricopeptide repeat protein [Candidatus Hermodarchaeota archaeon]
MSNLTSKELLQVQQLIQQAKFEKAFELIKILEESKFDNTKDQLSLYILKGKIFCYKEQYKQAIEVGELAYQLSQKLSSIFHSIESLLIKAYTVYLGNVEQGYKYIKEAEKLIKLISEDLASEFPTLEANLQIIKMMAYHFRTDHTKALKLAKQCLSILEHLGEKLEISRIYNLLVDIYLLKNNPNIALNYGLKSLELQEELKNPIGIATSLSFIGFSHFRKGDFSKALKFGRRSLMIKEISIFTKLATLHLLGAIYKDKGNIDRTLRYYGRAAKLAEKEGYLEGFIENTMGIGATYRMKGDFDQATKYLMKSLRLSEENNNLYGISSSLFYLILTNLDNNFPEKAHSYLEKLEEFTKQNETNVFKQLNMIAKALVLKRSGRMRSRAEAENLLIEVSKDEYAIPQLYLLAIVNLCDLYLEELYITNNLEILEDLNPLISRIFEIAEKQNSYLWLTETKLLQAKVALIQMKIEEAEILLTQAQQIAEMHGLDLLAIKISNEYDVLLEQLNTWDSLKKKDAPMSERIKLASFDGVINRMQGKSTIELPKLSHEIPVLLLIISEGGVPLFSNQFIKELSFEDDLISGFLTAFNNFSQELFAKRLDRAKFGEYTILMQSVSLFSICYLFKGQTYLAKQKFLRFVKHIQKSNTIWETMNKFYKSNRVIELKDQPLLETLIKKIFITKVPKLKA